MKTLLLIFCSLFLVNTSDNEYTKFANEVYENYSSYTMIDYSAEDYDLIAAKGVYNNKPAYGILFKSHKKNITLVLEINEALYELKKENGYYSTLAISAEEYINLWLYDDNGNKSKLENIEHSRLYDFDIDDLEESKMEIGNNQGKEFSTLQIYKQKISNYKIIFIGLISIIVICFTLAIIKIIYNKKHKPEKINNELNDEILRFINGCVPKQEEEYIEITPEEIINNEMEEEPVYIDNLNEHLMLNGFITDYKLITDDEKNKITIYLMKLKNEKKISNDQYLEEMYKIWKS